MPSLFARTILFLSGYTPLFLIFTIQYYPKYQYWALIPAGMDYWQLVVFLSFCVGSSPRFLGPLL